MSERFLTVTALNKYIKYKFDCDFNLTNVLLKGEISNFKKHSRGHFYFTVKDENSQISAIMFNDYASKIPFLPTEGMRVLLQGRVLLYEAGGSYQINVTKLEQDGIGSLYLAFEKLKVDLAKKGLFATEHKKPIPQFPKCIGVITSPTGAAIKDIINTVSRRYKSCSILLYPCLVQGENASLDIVKQIKLANKQKHVDVLIVGRGGGSIEDLWAFNEEIVAQAIYDSDIPIISAVGHETDFTIADFVADFRAPTPTAGAEIATPDTRALIERLDKVKEILASNLRNILEARKLSLMHLDERLELRSPKQLISSYFDLLKKHEHQILVNYQSILREKTHAIDLSKKALLSVNPKTMIDFYKADLDRKINELKDYYSYLLKEKRSSYDVFLAKLETLNPLSLMKKGYSIARVDGKIIKSINDVKKDDEINISVLDGKIDCLVK